METADLKLNISKAVDEAKKELTTTFDNIKNNLVKQLEDNVRNKVIQHLDNKSFYTDGYGKIELTPDTIKLPIITFGCSTCSSNQYPKQATLTVPNIKDLFKNDEYVIHVQHCDYYELCKGSNCLNKYNIKLFTKFCCIIWTNYGNLITLTSQESTTPGSCYRTFTLVPKKISNDISLNNIIIDIIKSFPLYLVTTQHTKNIINNYNKPFAKPGVYPPPVGPDFKWVAEEYIHIHSIISKTVKKYWNDKYFGFGELVSKYEQQTEELSNHKDIIKVTENKYEFQLQEISELYKNTVIQLESTKNELKNNAVIINDMQTEINNLKQKLDSTKHESNTKTNDIQQLKNELLCIKKEYETTLQEINSKLLEAEEKLDIARYESKTKSKTISDLLANTRSTNIKIL
jgi:hypothetical protein